MAGPGLFARLGPGVWTPPARAARGPRLSGARPRRLSAATVPAGALARGRFRGPDSGCLTDPSPSLSSRSSLFPVLNSWSSRPAPRDGAGRRAPVPIREASSHHSPTSAPPARRRTDRPPESRRVRRSGTGSPAPVPLHPGRHAFQESVALVTPASRTQGPGTPLADRCGRNFRDPGPRRTGLRPLPLPSTPRLRCHDPPPAG